MAGGGALMMLGSAGLLFAMVARFIEPSLFFSVVAYSALLFGGILATTGVARGALSRRQY